MMNQDIMINVGMPDIFLLFKEFLFRLLSFRFFCNFWYSTLGLIFKVKMHQHKIESLIIFYYKVFIISQSSKHGQGNRVRN